jgi:hypothetical protein
MILGSFGGNRDRFGEAAKHQGDSNARRYKAGDTLARRLPCPPWF